MKHFTRVVVFAVAGLSLALSVRAETGVHRIVATAAEATGDWADAAVAGDDAYGVIQAEIDASADGETVLLKAGTYAITNQLSISSAAITLCGEADARATTVIDGGYPSRTNRLFTISKSDVALRHFTLQNAACNDYGGAVYVNANNFTLDDCTVRNCYAGFNGGAAKYGGGVYISSVLTGVLITNSLFTGCAARMGGAIACCNSSRLSKWATRTTVPVISDCTFTENTAYSSVSGGSGATNHAQGAAVLGSLWVEHSTFRANVEPPADTYDAVVALDGYAVATNCLFTDHAYATCGPIAGRADCYANKARLTGCVFRNNSARYIFARNSNVENCTVVSNVFCNNNFAPDGGTFQNVLFAYNTGAGGTGNMTYDNCTFVTNEYGIFLGTNWQAKPTIRNCVSFGNTGVPSKIGGTYYGTADFCYERGWASSTGKFGTYRNNVALGCEKLQGYPSGSFSFESIDTTGASSNVIAAATEQGIRFRDPAKGDWRLKRKSPLRDTALTLDWMSGATDLDGRPRCIDKRGKATADALPDIGCYECEIAPRGLVLLVK